MQDARHARVATRRANLVSPLSNLKAIAPPRLAFHRTAHLGLNQTHSKLAAGKAMHAHLSPSLASQRSYGWALGSKRVTGQHNAPLPVPTPRQQAQWANKVGAQQQDACQPRGLQTCQQDMYEHALELSRQEKYDQARVAFEQLVRQHPTFCKAWVSYAQMERRMGRISDPLRLAVARQILQRGLATNPDSGCLAQAWGLMELQKGNFWAAVRLLERSVVMDPFLTPVLRWKPVSAARKTIAGSSRYTPVRARGVACASQGTATAAAAGGTTIAAAASATSGSTAAAGAGASSGGVGGGLSGGTGTGGSMSSM